MTSSQEVFIIYQQRGTGRTSEWETWAEIIWHSSCKKRGGGVRGSKKSFLFYRRSQKSLGVLSEKFLPFAEPFLIFRARDSGSIPVFTRLSIILQVFYQVFATVRCFV